MAWKTIYSKRAKKLGLLLREKRNDLDHSLRDMEAITGLSRTILYKIEIGERRLDVIEFLDLCSYLEADPIDIILTLQK